MCTFLILRHSLSSSHVVNAVPLNLESDEPNFTSARARYHPQLGTLPYTGHTMPLPCTPYITRSDQPIYTTSIWLNTGAWTSVCLVAKWSWGIQSLIQRSRDRRADTLQAQNNPSGIREWNDRITGVLENLLRWLIMPFMVGRHTAWREKSKCLTNENMDKLFT